MNGEKVTNLTGGIKEKPRADGKWSDTHLASTVKPGPQGGQRHDDCTAVIALDSIERRDPGKGTTPAKVLLQNVPQVSDIKGVLIVLGERSRWASLCQTCRSGSDHGISSGTEGLQATGIRGGILTESRDSFIFCSIMSRAEKPSSRKVKSKSAAANPLSTSIL